MQVAWIDALLGGMMIGASAVILWWMMAKIAGISGMSAGLLRPKSADFYWQAMFLLGVLCAPVVLRYWIVLPDLRLPETVWRYVLAGVLVGVGTRLASGCTSGHGICGNARLSPRSLLATLLFMLSGFLTVYVGRHILGWI